MSSEAQRRTARIADRRRRLRVKIAQELEANSRVVRSQYHQSCGVYGMDVDPWLQCDGSGIAPGGLIRILTNPETGRQIAFHWAKNFETCWHRFIWRLADQRARQAEAEAHPV